MRRVGVRPWTATVVACVLVFFGSGYQNIVLPFQMTLVGSLVFGLVQLLLATHDGRARSTARLLRAGRRARGAHVLGRGRVDGRRGRRRGADRCAAGGSRCCTPCRSRRSYMRVVRGDRARRATPATTPSSAQVVELRAHVRRGDLRRDRSRPRRRLAARRAARRRAVRRVEAARRGTSSAARPRMPLALLVGALALLADHRLRARRASHTFQEKSRYLHLVAALIAARARRRGRRGDARWRARWLTVVVLALLVVADPGQHQHDHQLHAPARSSRTSRGTSR